jgi:thioredoxin 1
LTLQEWTRETLQEQINHNQNTVLYLFTPLCGTCQVAGKMLSVTAELLPNLAIGKTDLNYIPDLAEQWEVESVPCLIIFHNSQIREKVYAFHSVPFLLEKLKALT